MFAQEVSPQDDLRQNGLTYVQLTPTRGKILLDGEWQASADNGKTWKLVNIPGTFDDKNVIFEKRIFIPDEVVSKNVFTLTLGTGGTTTEVRVNNEYVVLHNGAYSQFEVKIPDRLLQSGDENLIQIICNNELNPVSSIPLKQLAFQPKCYGGLFRDVYLEVKPPIYMDRPSIKISMNPNNSVATLESDVVVYASDYTRYGLDSTSTSLSLRGHAEIIDKSTGKVVAKSADNSFSLAQNHNTKLHFSMQVQDVNLWSPASPNLYEAVFYLNKSSKGSDLIDEYSENIGFRSFQLSNGKFFLNSDPIFIKGVNYVVDYPKAEAAVDDVQIEKDIAVIKTLGANAIRVVNYPPSPELLDLCDRFGLMVFEETPLTDAPPSVIEDSQYKRALQNYLRELISLTCSHPCVVAVSAGSNLDPTSKATVDLISSMTSIVHDDADRLVYYTPLAGPVDGIATDADFVGLDLTQFNSARKLKDFLTNLSQQYPSTVFWISSVGTQCQMSNHDGYSDPLSLEHQARYLVDAYGAAEEANVAGVSINSFADWEGATPHLMQNGHPYLYTFGLVSYWREKRPAFMAVRSLFSDETLPILPIGNYADSPPIIYVILSTLLLVMVTYLHYSRRWFRESAARAIFRPYNFFADIRDQRMISAFQTFTVLLLVAAGIAIYLSSLFYAYRDNYVFDRLLGILIPSDFLKIKIDYLVWHPAEFILAFTAFCMVVISFITLVIKLFSLIAKIRLQLVSAFTVATWSTLPMAVLILVDMILFRLLGDSRFVWGAWIVLVLLFLWSLLRLFHGIGVIYDLPTLRVGIIGSVFLIIVIVLLTVYYNGTDGVLSYTKFFYNFLSQNKFI
ncbi:MAG TPA: glycoside hydrolase family 2 TIM barrel-domain containing protein [Candidatus Acidoferrales bacterium]|nr:glycoside hydrolase family 2 TIM barrel-domain containing protein [Candidatus Acidoferrales bacterium]